MRDELRKLGLFIFIYFFFEAEKQTENPREALKGEWKKVKEWRVREREKETGRERAGQRTSVGLHYRMVILGRHKVLDKHFFHCYLEKKRGSNGKRETK